MTDKKIKIEQCTFAYQCPKSWDQLFRTNVDSVRFCDQCEKNVYLSNSSTEALEHASKGECVAIPIELTREAKQALDSRNMVVGMMGPPPDGPLSPGKENIEDLYVRSVDRPAEFYGIDGCPTGWFYVGIDIKGEVPVWRSRKIFGYWSICQACKTDTGRYSNWPSLFRNH